MHTVSPTPHAGFTLIEVLVILAVVAILSSVAYPSYATAMHKARRQDAKVALMQLHGAQARWRSEHPAYASLEDLRHPTHSPGRHYQLRVDAHSASGFTASAQAVNSQAGDAPCRILRLEVRGAQIRWLAGDEELAGSTHPSQATCWSH